MKYAFVTVMVQSINTYIHTYKHTHIHTYIHTITLQCQSKTPDFLDF